MVYQLTKREVVDRYRGSLLGRLWSVVTPLLMLAVYTFVFGVVFKARWGEEVVGSQPDFAIILFAGLIVHTFFAETINRAPTLMLANTNYVKRVIFPLEIFPWVITGTSLFNAFISTLVLLAVCLATGHMVSWTVLLLPFIFLPLIVLTVGIAWFLASLGTYIRDIGPTITILTTIMLFVSPVFFPIDAIPVEFQAYVFANPLTFIVEQTREVLIWGRMPNWLNLGIYALVAYLVAWMGYVWFQKTRGGFADVL